jgi:hypothetical protein
VTEHKHKAVRTIRRCFFGGVADRENRAAHGGICEISTCRCGATRSTNVNGPHIERGKWSNLED